jgi:hypothetical protein
MTGLRESISVLVACKKLPDNDPEKIEWCNFWISAAAKVVSLCHDPIAEGDEKGTNYFKPDTQPQRASGFVRRRSRRESNRLTRCGVSDSAKEI